MGVLSPSKITTMDEARKHRTYALVILMLVYAFNFIDRRILSILQTPIKEEFNLTDGQLGLLTGFLFAVVYTVIGIPVARIADATNRKTVITVSLTVWSAFTAISGLVTNYWQLALARMGVGVGEAGGSPPAHAIVSDLYEPDKRARALAIYSSGIYIGTLLGNVGGGWLSEAFDWRVAFMVVGLPGIALAILMQFTMREPLKGLSGLKPSTDKVTFIQSFKHLWSLKSFRYFSIATGLGTFVTYGVGDWMVPFMERSYGMSRSQIGVTYGVVAGVAGAIGTIGGGMFADWLGKRDKRWQLWVPMWGKLIGGPIFILGLLAPNPVMALVCYGIGLVMAAAYLGPSLAVTHSLVPPGMRAMSSAVLFFILNMIGLGLGPFLVGNFSDLLNDASACPIGDAAVQAFQACPTVRDVTNALLGQSFLPPKTLLTTDALGAALAGGFDLRPLLETRIDFLSTTLGQASSVVAAIAAAVIAILVAMKRLNWKLAIVLAVTVLLVFGGMAIATGTFDYTFRQWAFGLRSSFPVLTELGVNDESLRWSMVACVVFAYPFSILWHMGAQALPKPTTPQSTATDEALTEGDPRGSTGTAGPRA
ncbi:MAG: MFS transporter [Alphaproteobacteria bacterium]|nr:MFS transporter [Alphaproteobacteria bacterium]